MTTEPHVIDERNLNHLGGGQSSVFYSYRFTTSIQNNNISIGQNNQSSYSNRDTSKSSDEDHPQQGTRKPSYVGLSCTVSGYSNFTRYQSPSRKTSPSAIPVRSPPQVLDCNDYEILKMRQLEEQKSPPVRGQISCDVADNVSSTGMHTFFPSTQTSRVVTTSNGETTVETVTRFYANHSLQEESPCSESSSPAGSIGSANGNSSSNLVQKQIERLYGGRVLPVRLTSPEPKSPEQDILSPSEPGFFQKRFGIVKQRDYEKARSPTNISNLSSQSAGSPDSKKVPAVFRLLRPEFQELLKLNSFQVTIPMDQASAPPKQERIIPIFREGDSSNFNKTSDSSSDGRVIPIQVKATTHSATERIIPIEQENALMSSPMRIMRDEILATSTPSKPEKSQLKILTPRSPKSPVKPALPAKPHSPTGYKPFSQKQDLPVLNSHDSETMTKPPLPVEDFGSINISDNGHDGEVLIIEEDLEVAEKFEPESCLRKAQEELEDEFAAERFIRASASPPCGLRERTLLCPIQEEDTESTVSGCSSSLGARLANEASKEQTPSEVENVPQDSEVVGQGYSINQSKVGGHDGHYFIRLLENEIFKFEEQICDFEEDLANDGHNIPEDIRDSILAAIGKAKLLISQKFVQFRGLCEKNICQNPVEDPFVPTSEDLAGFWDMVFLQVDHINSLFADLSEMRQNHWRPKVEEETLKPEPQTRARKGPPSKKTKTGSVTNNTGSSSKKLSDAAKARDEARKRMIEEKKRLMKQHKQGNGESGDVVEMFIAT